MMRAAAPGKPSFGKLTPGFLSFMPSQTVLNSSRSTRAASGGRSGSSDARPGRRAGRVTRTARGRWHDDPRDPECLGHSGGEQGTVASERKETILRGSRPRSVETDLIARIMLAAAIWCAP